MKIWFGTTTLELEQYADIYITIRDHLIAQKHIVLFDWLDYAIKYRKSSPNGSRNIKDIYEETLRAIDQSDCVIIEYTIPNFSSSHQINYALQKRKPVLVMRLHKDNSYADSYIDAVESPYLKVIEYNKKNLKEVINEFLWRTSQDENGKNRYNIVLDQHHKYYLDWASAKYSKSRSSVIRDSLDKVITEDQLYTDYQKKIR